MRRVVVICEGQTEREFCNSIMSPFFIQQDIIIQAPLIKQSMGGIIGWQSLKKQIEITLATDSTAYVTTFIDYYGLYSRHAFPSWDEAEANVSRNYRMNILENGMLQDISETYRYRFIPYIQLHEFEALLFIDYKYYTEQFENSEIRHQSEFKKIFEDYENPELINNGPSTAPSKRLMKYIEGYNKPIYGNLMADVIGLNNIRAKCPRFNGWLEQIEAIEIL